MEEDKTTKEDNQEREQLAYSYHTFLYPFLYTCKKESEIPGSDRMGKWKREPNLDDLKFLDLKQKGPNQGEYSQEEIWKYNTYQYFFPKVNKYLFNRADGQSAGVHYRLDYGEKGTYTITYGEEKKEISLNINGIRLSLYPKFKIGVLVMEMEYFPEEDQESLKEKRQNALRINDLARRMFSPSVNYAYGTKSQLTSSYMTAESCRFRFSDPDKTIEIKYPEYEQGTNKMAFHQETKMSLLRQLLGSEAENVFAMEDFQSVLDDRMFVACLIRDDIFSKYPIQQILSRKEEDDCPDRLLTEREKEVYGFIFNDGNTITCQSGRMRREKLREHLYDRWIDWGTFHGATEYSLVCATGEAPEVENSVINPFLIEYIQMVKVALIQRAEIVKLEKDISDIAGKISVDGSDRDERIDEAMNKWTEYVSFQTELFMPEVTFQEQGVELYSILKKSLKINELKEHLDSEMSNFRVLAQISAEKAEKKSAEKMTRALNLLAVVGFVLSLYAASQDAFAWLADILAGENSYGSSLIYVIYGIVFLGLGLLSYLLFSYLNKEPSKDNKLKRKKANKKVSEEVDWKIHVIIIWALIMILTIVTALGVNHLASCHHDQYNVEQSVLDETENNAENAAENPDNGK